MKQSHKHFTMTDIKMHNYILLRHFLKQITDEPTYLKTLHFHKKL